LSVIGLGVVPDGHVRPRHLWQLNGTRETLVTLRIIILEADLEFDGLEEVSLLRLVGVFQKLLDVRAHSGDSDFRHDGLSSRKTDEVSLVRIPRLNVERVSSWRRLAEKMKNGLWAGCPSSKYVKILAAP
jgi:hypothetical protein